MVLFKWTFFGRALVNLIVYNISLFWAPVSSYNLICFNFCLKIAYFQQIDSLPTYFKKDNKSFGYSSCRGGEEGGHVFALTFLLVKGICHNYT